MSHNVEKDAPVRPCCGRRHYGVTCPDGMVMCCLCFERVPVAELHDEDGTPVNVCRPCADADAARVFPPAVTDGGAA